MQDPQCDELRKRRETLRVAAGKLPSRLPKPAGSDGLPPVNPALDQILVQIAEVREEMKALGCAIDV